MMLYENWDEIEQPVKFEIYFDKIDYGFLVGFDNFDAPQNHLYIPEWICKYYNLINNETLVLVKIIPKGIVNGGSLILKANDSEFMKLPNVKAILE